MNRILLIIALSMTVLSCTPTTPTSMTTAQSSVTFLANGTAITNTNSTLLLKVAGSATQVQGYVLQSMDGSRYSISLFLLTSSIITTATYNTTRVNYPSGEYTVFNFPTANNDYANIGVGDFMTVNITQIHNGFANGTFTAQMSRSTNSPTIVSITNGQFTNVPIQN